MAQTVNKDLGELNIDEEDVYETGSIDELISFLKRNINALNEQSVVTRKNAITSIHERLEKENFKITSVVSQQIMLRFSKQLLQTFSDKSEKCRQYAIKILRELIVKADDINPFLPYIVSVLGERANCHDLEGIQHLPEVMKPPPGQKPKQMIKFIEESEELRIELCNLVMDLVKKCENQELYNFLDETCNILRAFAMDPCSDLQRLACQTISVFCKNNTEILLHFTEMLCRGVLLPLISKKSKVRIAALEALGSILQCGIWKYNAFVFEILIGFRDPNSVPIKAFYEPMHNINYFATLIEDPKFQVRDYFVRCCGEWLINLADRYDHHPRLIPYILSGLFDKVEELRTVSFEILEEAGLKEEKEKEKELRDNKQFGVDSEWTANGKLANLPLPHPFPRRPCLGARILVRSHVRKYWKAMYGELKGTSVAFRERTANLFLMNTIYSEDYLTQFLDVFIRNLIIYTVPKNAEDSVVAEKICLVFELVGRFCPWTTYLPMVTSGMKGEFSQNDDYMRASIKALGCLVKGELECSVREEGLSKTKIEFIEKVVEILTESQVLDSLQHFNNEETSYLLRHLINLMIDQSSEEQQVQFGQKIAPQLLRILFINLYLTYFDKVLILTVPYDKEIGNALIEKLESSELVKLGQKALSICYDRREVLDKIFEDVKKEVSSFQTHFWKQLIGQLTFQLFSGQGMEVERKVLERIEQVVKLNNNPEISDFIVKYCLFLGQQIMRSKVDPSQLNLYRSTQELIGTASFFYASTESKLSDKIINNYLVLLQNVGDTIFSAQLKPLTQQIVAENSVQGISKILWSVSAIFNKYFRRRESKDLVPITSVIKHLIDQMQEEIRSKCQNLQIRVKKPVPKKEDQPQEEEWEDIFIIPHTFNFLIRRIEQLGENPSQKVIDLTFGALSNFINLIPEYKNNYFRGSESIIEDYEELVEKLLKYTVNEKDLEMRERYFKILQKLKSKTPLNFQIQFEIAEKHSQHARIDLLRRILFEEMMANNNL